MVFLLAVLLVLGTALLGMGEACTTTLLGLAVVYRVLASQVELLVLAAIPYLVLRLPSYLQAYRTDHRDLGL